MVSDKREIHAIFNDAIALVSEEDRQQYLDRACGDDLPLRARAEALLDAHFKAGGFLGGKTAADATKLFPTTEHPGTVIGPYKLLQQIGEGGMGVVFMAEQSQPIQRTVALKIIKPGMDTRQVIARFEAERQALAMMDHPNIAKVLDAGTTDSGRPYFVMELVKGVPITKYCDDKQLPLCERLELFMQVCQAVQHAHQKGIIHRDIKPNNVLVADYDNRPIPKVIDFGVAKATAQRLTERTMFTEFGQVLGTMEYMSPEQSKFNQLDIDTRSDIYSLGVLLYELLTGSTPFEGKRLHEAAFDEMLRIIREEEPQKPSTRISSIDTLPSVAANRHTEPSRLSKDVRGELDWIVMKALEKDRNRRYETAIGFAADIDRHLRDEPVEAGPPSAAYRFQKFARRNKAVLLIGSTAFALLLLLVVGLAASNRMIAAERDAKAQALTEKELALALAGAQAQLTYFKDALQYRRAEIGPRDTDKMYHATTKLLDRAASLPLTPLPAGEVAVRERIGHVQRDLAYMVRITGSLDLSKDAFERSIRTFEQLKEQVPSRVDYWHFVADSHRELGRIAMDRKMLGEAEKQFRQAIDLHEQRPKSLPSKQTLLGEEAAAYYDLARLLIKTGRREEAVTLIARGAKVSPVVDAQSVKLSAQIELADLLGEAGELDQALALYSEVVELATTTTPEVKFRLADGCSRLAKLLRNKGKMEPAERTYRQALALREPLKQVAPPTARLAQSFDYNDLGFVLATTKRMDEAKVAVQCSLELKQALVSEFPDNRDYRIHVAHSYLGIGHLAVDSGQTSDAVRAYGEVTNILSKLVTEPSGPQQLERFLRDTLSLLSNAWRRINRPDDAKHVDQKRLGRVTMLAAEFPDNSDYQLDLARLLCDAGALDTAFAQCAKIIAKNPNLPEAWNTRGDCYNRRREFDKAADDYSMSIKLRSDGVEAWTGRAWSYFQLQLWDKAVADYSTAIEFAPEVHTTWYHRGLANLELAHWDKAATDFTHIVDGWPNEPGGWYLRALAYAQLTKPDMAVADLRQAIARGYNDMEQLRTDSRLDPLRANE